QRRRRHEASIVPPPHHSTAMRWFLASGLDSTKIVTPLAPRDTGEVNRGLGRPPRDMPLMFSVPIKIVRALSWTEPRTRSGQVRFETRRAVAVAARPRLGAVQILASTARVGVLNSLQHEVLFPVLPLLLERRGAVADLHPLHASIFEFSRLGHVAQVLVAGHGAAAESAFVNRLRQ